MTPAFPSLGRAGCRVLCVGDLTADIVAHPMSRLPEPGEVQRVERVGFFPGGNALNIAMALQRLGEPSAIVGSLGDDAVGDLLFLEMQRAGLDVRGVRREPGCATPTTLMVRVEGEDRRFVHAPGAGERFTGGEVAMEQVPSGGVVVAAGYLKLPAWEDSALERLLRQARERGSMTVLNVCIPLDGRVGAARALRLLPLVDVFVPNEDEARILTGASQVKDQARALRQAGARIAAVTRGPRGVYAEGEEGAVELGAYAVPLVDPSGCGDCFTAGLVVGLLRRWGLERTLMFASAVGALGATALGCTSGVPPMAEVERFIENRPAPIPPCAA